MAVDNKLAKIDLSRRDALRLCLAPMGVAAAGWLAGCGEGGEGFDDYDTLDQRIGGGIPRADAGAAPGVSPGAASPGIVSGWATGGTKAMQGNYPDPFATDATGAPCALYPAMTLGPCYARGPAEREDISDGMPGLPVRLSFLVVRSGACSPVPNATVDIWHTGSNGTYSAFASGTCNPSRLPVANQRFCRGVQTTDANGRADFSTIFPGHYPGRSIHIHFTVRTGSQTFTSQLFFDDKLNDEIMTLPDYTGRGQRNTTNSTDGILRRIDLNSVLMSTTKRSDGVLHAWKVLSIRA